MWVSSVKKENITFELIDRLLFDGLEDTGEDADCIIVLGSMKAATYRVPVAVSAYKAGRAEKMILCGGVLHDFSVGTFTEADYMRKTALELGVPEGNIIIENSSQNTVENILCARSELELYFGLGNIRSVLLVTTAYHMRRSLMIAKNLFPPHIRVLPCPANDTNTRHENWMNTTEGILRAKGEAMNLVRYIVNGVIPDFEI
jgi:uncharacterized SAM-binding protein YcdF (DUF218 family)